MDGFLESIKPLYIAGRIFGYFPFKILENGEIKVSKIAIIQSVINSIIFCVVLCLRRINLENYKVEGSFISRQTFFFASLFCVCVYCITMWTYFFQRNKFTKTFARISKIDMKIEEFSEKRVNYHRHGQKASIFLTSASFSFVSFGYAPWMCLAMKSNSSFEEMMSTSLLYFLWCAVLLYSITCCISADLILKRFENFNAALGRIRNISSLNHLSRLHFLLCEMTNSFNQLYCHLKALLFGTILMCGTFISFEVFDIFATSSNLMENSRQISFTSIIVIVGLHFAFSLNLFVYISSKIMKNGAESGTILSRKFCKLNPKLLFEKRLRMFILQLEHVEPKISCGMFEFNWTIVYSVS